MANRGFDREVASATLRFIGTAWRNAWGAISLLAFVFAGLWATGRFEQQSPGRSLALVGVLVCVAVLEGGLYRVATGKGGRGPAGLQFRGEELRLMIVWGLTGVFLFILSMLAFVVVLAFAFAVATAGHGFVIAEPATWAGAVEPAGRAVVAVVATLAGTGLLWCSLRIAFGGAASVAEGRVRLLDTWPLTRGRVFAMLLGRILIEGPPLAACAAALEWGGAATTGGGVARWGAGLTAGLFIAGVWLPAHVGLMSILYTRAESSSPTSGS